MKTMTLALGGGAVVAAAVAAAVLLRPLPEGRAPAPVAAVDVEPEPVVPNGVAPAQEVAQIDVPPEVESSELEAAEVAEVENVEPEVAEVEAVVAPPVRTDFRFEPDGSWLVSGLATPGLPLAVLVDGAEVARVDVGADGAFLALGAMGFSDSPRMMRLVSDPEGAAVSADQTFVLAANPAPIEVAATEAGEPALQPDQPAETTERASQEEPSEAAAADAEAQLAEVAGTPPDEAAQGEAAESAADPVQAADPVAASPASPAILAVTQEGVEVVQPSIAADTPPEVMSNVALDTITYDPDGEVVLRGRALGEGFVQVYVDNAPVSRLPVDAQGNWRGDLPDVDTGVYTLRIDEVDAEGAVVSRIETPFLREDPADVVEAMAEDVANPEFTVATRTVQPGATLWAIAEERYGAGVLYVNVFEANRDRIRDPDLIYPGQVFVLPESDN